MALSMWSGVMLSSVAAVLQVAHLQLLLLRPRTHRAVPVTYNNREQHSMITVGNSCLCVCCLLNSYADTDVTWRHL